jgi:hypothetical protein
MQKYGTRTTQMINRINEVQDAGSNTTNADSLRAMNGRKDDAQVRLLLWRCLMRHWPVINGG